MGSCVKGEGEFAHELAGVVDHRDITRLFLNHSPCAVALVDRNMRYLAVSPRWIRDYGLEHGDVLGRSHYEIFPDVPQRWKDLHRRALTGESLSQVDDSFVRSDGRLEWVDWQLNPWRTPGGNIGGILIITEVTTWRHAAEQRLREKTSRFRAAFEEALIGMAICSLEGRWLRVNRALTQILGYSAEEFAAMDFQAITHPEDLPRGLRHLEQVTSGVPPHEFKYQKRYLHKDGRIVWVDLSGTAVLGGDGRPSYFIVQIQDITAGKQAEMRIAESEQRIRTITDHVPITIGLFDMDDVIRFANAEFRRIGTNQMPPEGQPASAFIPSALEEIAAPYRARARAGESVHFVAKPVIDGDERIREVTYIPARDAAGQVNGVYGIAYDITEITQQKQALAQRESELSAIFAALTEALVVQARDGRIIDANRAAEVLLGLPREALLKKSSLDADWNAVHEDGTPFPGAEHPPMRAMQTGEPVRGQVAGIRASRGELRWISINAQPLPATDPPSEAAVITTMVDITGQRNAFEQIRGLAQRLEEVRESERRELSKRLHDGVAQNLFAMSLTLELLNRESKGRVGVMTAYEELHEGLDRCMTELRQVANDLRPAALSHLGVGTALKEHATYFSRLSGLAIEVHETAGFPVLGESERLLLFRTAQEALTNISKHAQASKVDMTLSATDSTLLLTITDDGIGIAPEALTKPTSLGLLGLGERFRALGGSFAIGKSPGFGVRGTVMQASLPRQGSRRSERREAG